VTERAAEIRTQYNLRPPDAIQISSAILEDAQAFITNDEKLKRVKEIKGLVKEVFLVPQLITRMLKRWVLGKQLASRFSED
jgi:hypothetical protein